MDTESEVSKICDDSKTPSLMRVIHLLSVTILIVGSLLTFPAGLPLLVFVWLTIAAFYASAGRSPWKELLALLVILLIKNPEWSFAFLVLILGLAGTSAVCFRQRQCAVRTLPVVLVLVFVATFYAIDYRTASSQQRSTSFSLEKAVVCLGDSLTDFGYPQELEKLISHPVVDLGRDGIASEDGLKFLPEILALEPPPCVVVLELGGHDYNQGKSRESTRKNLATLIESLKAEDIDVLIVEVPRGFVRDPFRGIERELARTFDLELIADSLIRKFVLFSNICPPGTWLPTDKHLSNDGLHPNENGNRLFATTVAEALKQMGVR